jgi:hypothetical protein
MSPWPLLTTALSLAIVANACLALHKRWRRSRATRTTGAAVTRRLLHALAALYGLVALVLVHLAVTAWQNGAWPHAAFLAGASLLLVTAVIHHSYQRDELRYAHQRLERASRPPEPAFDGVIAVALAGACCERWWTSAGTEHETSCERHRSAA